MSTNSHKLGVWIDHAQAVFVKFDGEKGVVRSIPSNIEGGLHFSGGSGPRSRRGLQMKAVSEKKFVNKREGQLHAYYKRVVDEINSADEIVIFGPGEAKNELLHEMKKQHLDQKVKGVFVSDRLTNAQLIERVRNVAYHGI